MDKTINLSSSDDEELGSFPLPSSGTFQSDSSSGTVIYNAEEELKKASGAVLTDTDDSQLANMPLPIDPANCWSDDDDDEFFVLPTQLIAASKNPPTRKRRNSSRVRNRSGKKAKRGHFCVVVDGLLPSCSTDLIGRVPPRRSMRTRQSTRSLRYLDSTRQATVVGSSRNRRKNYDTVVDLTEPERSVRQRRPRNSSKKQPLFQVVVLDDSLSAVEGNNTAESDRLAKPSPEPDEDEFNYEINVKVIWKSTQVVKIPMRRQQKMTAVYQHLAELEKVQVSNILLTLRNKPVSETDTPHSLDLKIVEFLEGGVVTSTEGFNIVEKDKNKRKIRFQDGGKKVVTIPFSSDQDRMGSLMAAYAEELEKPLSAFRFHFDGERVKPDDTIESLGIEDNDVIDVKLA